MHILVTLALLMLTLSSCEVNWGNTSYDVPWYYVAIPVTIFVIAVTLLTSYIVLKRTYMCPKCEKEFKPKWYNLFWVFHFCGSRLFKCPHCKKVSFCHPCFYKKKDSEDSAPEKPTTQKTDTEKTDTEASTIKSEENN